MIKRKMQMVVKNDEALFTEKLILYKNDGAVVLTIEIANLQYTFSNKRGIKGAYVDVVILKPNGETVMIENAEVKGTNTVEVNIGSEIMNEESEVGKHLMQLRIYETSEKKNRICLPIVSFLVKQ